MPKRQSRHPVQLAASSTPMLLLMSQLHRQRQSVLLLLMRRVMQVKRNRLLAVMLKLWKSSLLPVMLRSNRKLLWQLSSLLRLFPVRQRPQQSWQVSRLLKRHLQLLPSESLMHQQTLQPLLMIPVLLRPVPLLLQLMFRDMPLHHLQQVPLRLP